MSPPPPNLTIFAVVVLVIVSLRPAAAYTNPSLYGTAPSDPADDDDMYGSPYDENKLASICQLADDPKTCESTIQSLSPGLSTTTPVNILKIHMEAAGRNALAGQQEAAKLLKANPATKAALETCVKEYVAAAVSIGKVVAELAKASGIDKPAVLTGMSSVAAASQNCEDAVKAASKNATSPMDKYSDENARIIGNAVKLFVTYWSVEESDAAGPSGGVDMDVVQAICDKVGDAAECLNSVRLGERLLPFKGDADAFAVLRLSGRAMEQSRKQAAKIMKEKGITACDKPYSDAGGSLHEVVDVEMANGSSEKVDGAKLKKQLSDITKSFKECQAALDKAGGNVDARLMELQKRLQAQAVNNEALAGIVWYK